MWATEEFESRMEFVTGWGEKNLWYWESIDS
jgi:hypothetical protein